MLRKRVVLYFKCLYFSEKRNDITAAFVTKSTGNKLSDRLKEDKCLLVQIKSIFDKTPWRKVSDLSPCPFDETANETQPLKSLEADAMELESQRGGTVTYLMNANRVTDDADITKATGESTGKYVHKALAEKQVSTADPTQKTTDTGELGDVTSGTSGRMLAHGVMLFLIMHLITYS